MRVKALLPEYTVYIFRMFLAALIASSLFFVLALELADLFLRLTQYMQHNVVLEKILLTMKLYLPKAFSWSLPVSILFSISFSLGQLNSNNEQMAIFSSGISLMHFTMPVLVFSILLSFGYFWFEDSIVIPAENKKVLLVKELTDSLDDDNEMLGQISLFGSSGRLIWNIKSFDKNVSWMNGVTIIERDDDKKFRSRLDAQSAEWLEDRWLFRGVRLFSWDGAELKDAEYAEWSNPDYNQEPDSFQAINLQISGMQIKEARRYIAFLKESGLPFNYEEAEYLKRFSFSLTPFVVALLSVALSGFYKKNILLMSLFVSLLGATIYYVAQMVSMLLAKNGTLTSFWGAFFPLLLFASASFIILLKRRI